MFPLSSFFCQLLNLTPFIFLEEFLSCPSERHTDILDQVNSILGGLDIQPNHHPMHEAFWYLAVKDAGLLREKLEEAKKVDAQAAEEQMNTDATQPGATTLRTVYEMLTTTETHQGLEFIARMTRKYILPQLDDTRTLAEAAEDIYTVDA
jgi:hypothetical protein